MVALRGGVTACTGTKGEGLQRDALVAPGTRPGTRDAWLPPLAPASWSRGHAVGVEEAGESVVERTKVAGTVSGTQGMLLTAARRGGPAGEGREDTRGEEEEVLNQAGASRFYFFKRSRVSF